MKKLLGLFAAALLALTLCIGAFAAEKTVYVAASGNDANGGASYSEAVKTLDRAYALIGESDGKIVVCSVLNIGASYVAPEHDGVVTITSSDGKNYFPLGKIAFSTSLTFAGDTVIDRIALAASGNSLLVGGGNDLTLGKDIVTTGSIAIIGGKNVTAAMSLEEASVKNDYTVTVNAGTFTYIRGGNRRVSGDSPFGVISGNCTVNLLGGEFTAVSSALNTNAAAGMNSQTGNVTVNIDGATIAGNFYAVGRGGSNEIGAAPTVTGDVTINFNGGVMYGKKLDENQDNSIALGGKYTLNLKDGNLPHIESIKGGANATLNISDALKNGGGIVETAFSNPLRGGADPWVIYHGGYYYMTIVQGVSVYCYKSATLEGIAHVEGVKIWTAPTGDEVNETNKYYSQEIWSPELHYVEESEFGKEYAGWWLYFAADDGNNINHRLYTVRALTDDALGQYGSPVTREVNVPVKMLVDNDKTWAIGQSLLRANGQTYLTWTSETGRGTAEHKQDIRIAKLENPYTVGASNIICYAEYDWESNGYAYNANTGESYPKVVEGATAVYGDNGEIMIVYSASGYWTTSYCLSTLTLKTGADPLKKDSWVKATEPCFTRQYDVFGPGHAAYTTDALGNRWMMYHAYLDYTKVGRYVFIQPWNLDGTTVEMNGGPYKQSTEFTIYNEQAAVYDAVSGFGIK